MVVDVRLVPLSQEHVGALRTAMTDPAIQRFTRVPVEVTDAWVEGWVGRFADARDGASDGEKYGWAVVDERGALVGYAVTGPVDREGLEVEVGYAVVPDARGRGVATATLHALSAWALDAGMQRVVALVSTANPASARVAARAGFTFEGVLRSVHHRDDQRVDLQSWSLLPGELSPLPTDPRPA